MRQIKDEILMHILSTINTIKHVHFGMLLIMSIFGVFAGSFKTDMPMYTCKMSMGITLSTGVISIEQSIEKYPDAMTLFENNPQLADKSSKDFYYTEEEQSAALLEVFRP